jgi:hypothetical protein
MDLTSIPAPIIAANVAPIACERKQCIRMLNRNIQLLNDKGNTNNEWGKNPEKRIAGR